MTIYDIRHLFSRSIVVAVATTCVSTIALGQQPPQQPAQPDPAALARQAELNKRPDTPGTGRFPAMKEEVASLPKHVVYRPKDLASLGSTKLAVPICTGEGPFNVTEQFGFQQILRQACTIHTKIGLTRS